MAEDYGLVKYSSRGEIVSMFGKMKPKKLIKGVAKTAMKASPIPIPDVVQEQLGLASDTMKSMKERLDRIESMVDELIIFTRDMRSWVEDEEETD